MVEGQHNGPAPSGPAPEGGREGSTDQRLGLLPRRAPTPRARTHPPRPPPPAAPEPGRAAGGTVTGRRRHTAHGQTRQQGLTRQLLTPRAAPGAAGHQTAPAELVAGRGAQGHAASHPPPATGTPQGTRESVPPEAVTARPRRHPATPSDAQWNPAVEEVRAWAFKPPPTAAGDLHQSQRRGATGNSGDPPPNPSPPPASGMLRAG